jgi:DNA-binding IclR family transcriptional regulator
VPGKVTPERPNYQIRSVERALDVLEAFTAEDPALHIDTLCERTHLPKSTAFKILSVLEHRDYVQRNQDGGSYRVGFQAFEVGNKYLAGLTMLEIVQPTLKRLVARFPHSAAHVAVLSPTETKIVYVDVRTRNPILVPAPIGSQFWAHATALGKCLLAGLTREALERRLARIEMPQLTAKTITDPGALRKHLDQVRAQGYAIDDEELSPGNLCVAVPCRDRQGTTVASISTSHVKEAMTDDMASVVTEMCQVARDVSKAMGYAPTPAETPCP